MRETFRNFDKMGKVGGICSLWSQTNKADKTILAINNASENAGT